MSGLLRAPPRDRDVAHRLRPEVALGVVRRDGDRPTAWSSWPAGRTRVGSDDPDHPEEWPVREVALAPYAITRHAVTNADFASS